MLSDTCGEVVVLDTSGVRRGVVTVVAGSLQPGDIWNVWYAIDPVGVSHDAGHETGETPHAMHILLQSRTAPFLLQEARSSSRKNRGFAWFVKVSWHVWCVSHPPPKSCASRQVQVYHPAAPCLRFSHTLPPRRRYFPDASHDPARDEDFLRRAQILDREKRGARAGGIAGRRTSSPICKAINC